MNIAFVGIEKDWEDLDNRGYTSLFIKFHLELPYYYARDGNNKVWIVTNCYKNPYGETFKDNDAHVITQTPEKFKDNKIKFDVVVHWRKWIEDCYRSEAINVINSQDHSYSPEWLIKVGAATEQGKLKGILCFPEWHQKRLTQELSGLNIAPPLMPGVTLGVDTQVYRPSKNKNRQGLLWASDPGRGLQSGFTELAAKLFRQGFVANVCQPDYVKGLGVFAHPAFKSYRNLDNGPELWNLFNDNGFLPYTSTFPEPSSRAHRQAMAAGMVVLYPPNMGTPSDLLTDNVDGFVRPVSEWVDIITMLSEDRTEFDRISKNARAHAVRENWEVQAKRFNELFKELLNDN